MRFSFDTYWPLALLLLIPYVLWVQRRTLTDVSPKHLQLAGAVRSTIVALIAFALMQPVLYRAIHENAEVKQLANRASSQKP